MPLKKTNREREKEKSRGKLRYLERLAQTREADKELKEFEKNEDCTDGSDSVRSLRDRPFGS